MSDENNGAPDGAEYGQSLRGLGLNLLVSSVTDQVAFLTDVMGLEAIYADDDFAIMRYQTQEFMLHVDGSYTENPLLSLTGDGVVRGAGIELRLYEADPDGSAEKAEALGHYVLQEPTTKGHGLREAYIVGPDGYVWVPSRKDV